MTQLLDDHGIRLEYPDDWVTDVTRDGPRTILTLSEPGGAAFLLITLDTERTKPATLADEALAVMREEYPNLDAYPVLETIARHQAVGHDFEFFYLDLVNTGTIRAFRTPTRSILLFAQWSAPVEGDDLTETFRSIRQSLNETDDAQPR